MTVALIDGDEAIYKACVIKVEETDWEAETVTDRPPTFEEARAKFHEIVREWCEAVDADSYIVCLSPKERGLFRRGIYAPYKGARGEKPEQYKPLEDWVFANENSTWRPGLEADDVMGLLSGPGHVICSNDKDMKTVPGRLYITGKKKLVTITETRADWQWMYQTLMGDPTDGFGGCIGCGPKGAEAVLEGCRNLAEMAHNAALHYLAPKKGKYKDVIQTALDFRRMAALARILRPTDYDNETGDVRYALPGVKDIAFNAQAIAK
ncbi:MULTISPECIES: hypothetical protein [Burkholderia]|uniref:hypothetical protein n=1 Tax=Burkholderia TaxID=32008 RepID=UPI000751AD12|nr:MULTISPECIES: hypothetical protein [Burkholderia]AOJ72257.1 hypothetical protein WS78_26380 [Burkholderia savannae]KVG44254.1 hypothetical protein WS77_10000 [Burkholderia sp. MSMB0265]KVG87782.1 hypothetical protein WS81_25985 [Burkholderia sp. MSMB2040]KVG96375.1 hypothetical protein WS83_03170 [Burkholderia sp. MSMB2042]KVG97183.1 hypothetical protein WS82_30210 [Burkholderia sp. MSMB2041]